MTRSTVDSPSNMDVWARLHRASALALEQVEAELKRKGFPPLGWYDVLLELRRAENRTLRPVEIERRSLLAQYNVSRLIDRLVGAGYAQKLKAPDDGRGVVVHLTQAGEELIEAMWPVYQAAANRAFSAKLSARDHQDLWRILGQVLSE